MSVKRNWKIWSVVLGLVLFSAGLQARPDANRWQLAANDSQKPLAETVERYGKGQRNRVLAAEPKKQNGQEVHRIRVLTNDGRVKTLLVDPKTGREIRR